MNKFLTLTITALSSLPMFAALNTMNYQAVINNANGQPASETPIGLRFAIVANDATLFTEETVVTSSEQGLVEWQIGSTTGNGLANIDWDTEGISLQVSIDLNGGTNYTNVYTSTIQAVPTAMYAVKSGDSDELRNEIYFNRDYITSLDMRSEQNSAVLYEHTAKIEANTAEIARVDEYAHALEELYGNLGVTLDALSAKVSENSTDIEDILKKGLGEIDNIKEILDKFESYGGEIKDLLTYIDTIKQEIANLTTVNIDLRDTVSTLIVQVEANVGRLESLYQSYATLGYAVDENRTAIANNKSDIANIYYMTSNVETKVAELNTFANEIYNKALGEIDTIKEAISKFTGYDEVVKNLSDGIAMQETIIAALQQKVVEQETILASQEAKIETQESKISALEDRISDLLQMITENIAIMANMQDQIDELKNK